MKKINDTLHKEFIINKILCALDGKKDKIIVYPLHIQKYGPTTNINKNDKIYYGQYNTTDHYSYKTKFLFQKFCFLRYRDEIK